jgi:hypothetical protein
MRIRRAGCAVLMIRVLPACPSPTSEPRRFPFLSIPPPASQVPCLPSSALLALLPRSLLSQWVGSLCTLEPQ